MISSKPKRFNFSVGSYVITLLFVLVLMTCFFLDMKVSKKEWGTLSAFILLIVLIHFWKKIYYSGKEDNFYHIVLKHLKVYFAFLLLGSVSYMFVPMPNFTESALFWAMSFPVLGVTLSFISDASKRGVLKESTKIKNTLVAGTGNMASKVEKQLYNDPFSGYRIKGFIHCLNKEECLVPKEKVVGDLASIKTYLEQNSIDEIVIALPGNPRKKIQHIIETADYFGIRVKYIPNFQELFGSNYKVTRFGGIDALNIHELSLDGKLPSFFKASFDFLFSTIALILLTPLFLLLALLIKLESPGPVFYCPVRVGKSGKSLKVFKFRTMHSCDSSTNGVLSTQKDDPRITRLGKIMRKYSLDELPQFINVFLGEMSVVGPRPHRQFLDRQLQESVYKYKLRHYVKPGITGWAQVNGWRGPTDTEEQRRQRTLHDLWYLENWSMWLDVKIIFLTIFSKKAHKSAF